MIPSIFHLTSKTKHLNAQQQKNVDRIRELYPDFEIRVHDDEDIHDFMTEYFQTYYEDTISRMPEFIMVVDTVRYMWMHVYGGVYCDTDIYFRQRIDFTSPATFIAREWTYPPNNDISISLHNCIFASEPGHPVWQELLGGIAQNVSGLSTDQSPRPGWATNLDRLLQRARLKERVYPRVFDTTGPNAISLIASRSHGFEERSGVSILPAEVLFQRGMSRGSVENAFVVHETAGSWVPQ